MKYITSLLGALTFCTGAFAQTLDFQISNDTVNAGETFELDVRTDNFTNMLTFQFSIGWDSALLHLDTLEAYNATLPLSTANFNFTQRNAGKLGMYWFDVNNKTLPAGALLFKLKFTANTLGITTVAFSNDPTEIFAESASGIMTVDTTNGSVAIVPELPVLPENDLCAGAVSLQNLLGNGIGNPQTSTIFDNTNAGANAADPETGHDCFFEETIGQPSGLDNSLWFKFTGDGHHYRITTVECGTGSDYINSGDAQIAVYKGNCGNLEPVDCNEDQDVDNNNYAAQIDDLGAEQLVEYFILIDGCRCIGNNSDVARGQFCIQMEQLSSVATRTPVSVNKISLSPNPAVESAELFFETTVSQEMDIQLADRLGRPLSTILPTRNLPSGAQRIPVDLAGLPSGLYFVVLNGTNGKETLKLTKM